MAKGFPDFNCDPVLQQHLDAAVHAGHNQYAPMPGVPALRLALAAKCEALYGRRYDAGHEITITAGATQAVMASVIALVQPGDEVIVFEPTYDSYVPSIVLAGATPCFVPLDAANGYAPDWDTGARSDHATHAAADAQLPAQPDGPDLRTEDLSRSGGNRHATRHPADFRRGLRAHRVRRPAASVADALERARRAHGRGLELRKTFHTTGWKVGYAMAPHALTAEIRKVHQFMVFAVNTPAQHAFAAYLQTPAPYLELPAFYQAKRDLLIAGLRSTPFRVLPCEGTYFVLADYSALSAAPGTRIRADDDREVRCRGDSGIGVLRRADRSARGALLFRQERRNPARSLATNRGGAVAAGTDRAMTLANWQTIESAALPEDQDHLRGHPR